MTDPLDDLLKELGISTAASRLLFREKATLLELPRYTDIFVEGKKNRSEYLLVSGIVHRHNLSDKGDVVTTGFYLSRSVITPHFARTYGGKSLFGLQTLTEVVLAEIPVSELDRLRSTDPEFHLFGQRVVERELARAVLLEVSFRSFSARERLLELRRQYPNLENSIPHTVIASYLGITQVSLSRLRHDLARE